MAGACQDLGVKSFFPILGFVACSAVLQAAIPNHFEGWKWKEKETAHFLLRADGTSFDPASRYAEKVWEVVVEVLPGLEKEFADNAFKTPGGGEAAEGKPYRHTVYLLGKGDDFSSLVDIDKDRNGWDPNSVRMVRQTGNYADPQFRYGVFCKVAPDESAGDDREIDALFVHSTGMVLQQGWSRSKRLPFWMTAGFGYYVEHRLFRKCRVHYLDFEAYYEENEAEIKRGETLDADRSWADVIRKLCKDEKRRSLEQVCSAQVLTLSPEDSGYIFALTCFLVRDEPARVKYRTLLDAAREGRMVDKALLLKSYGYADDAALEQEWYEWLESRQFK